MNSITYRLLVVLIVIPSHVSPVSAQDDPAKDAMQQLKQVEESGQLGDAKKRLHSEAAESDLIRENKEKPYPQPSIAC